MATKKDPGHRPSFRRELRSHLLACPCRVLPVLLLPSLSPLCAPHRWARGLLPMFEPFVCTRMQASMGDLGDAWHKELWYCNEEHRGNANANKRGYFDFQSEFHPKESSGNCSMRQKASDMKKTPFRQNPPPPPPSTKNIGVFDKIILGASRSPSEKTAKFELKTRHSATNHCDKIVDEMSGGRISCKKRYLGHLLHLAKYRADPKAGRQERQSEATFCRNPWRNRR